MLFKSNAKHPAAEELEVPEALEVAKKRYVQMEEMWAERDRSLGHDYPAVNDFYRGRDVFVTGGSGFCGKVIVEKLLHVCPDIGTVYLLVRAGRRGESPEDRLKAMVALPLFDRLRMERPAALDKMVAVRGDCMLPGLGLAPEDRRMLTDRVSVIFHSAASVRFNDPVMKATRMNTCSTMEVVQLGREMKGLKVLVHISTAYCNTIHNPTMERTYPTEHSYEDVLKYIKLPDAHLLDNLGHKFLGYQPNSYVFSKALSEQVIRDAAKDLPVIIVRPTIVTCALEEPVPGWMDNLNGFAMFWAVVSKGVMRVAYMSRDDTKFDLVPVDTVSRLTILASWARGTGQDLPCEPGDVQVVNQSCGELKPTTMFMMMSVFKKHLEDRAVAYPDVVRYPHVHIFFNYPLFFVSMLIYHCLYGLIVDKLLVAFGQKPQLMDAYRKIESANQALAYFSDTEFLFQTDNMWRLLGITHPRDRDQFVVLREDIPNWYDLSRDQLLGVCKYALKEPIRGQEDLNKNARIINIWWWVEFCWYIFLAAVAVYFAARRFA